MARKLKTYQTSLGFFDQAIAAPSMKAALEAWGTTTNLFHQGVAKEVDDPEIIAATMRKPGLILRRPVHKRSQAEDARWEIGRVGAGSWVLRCNNPITTGTFRMVKRNVGPRQNVGGRIVLTNFRNPGGHGHSHHCGNFSPIHLRKC
jgi:hypothetical protein